MYDMIFMDCQMPIMDGFEATRTMRQIEAERAQGGHVLISAMTANAMAEDREACFASGMDDFMPKPIEPKKLEQLLLRYFTEYKPHTPSTAALLEDSGHAPINLEQMRLLADTPEEMRYVLHVFFTLAEEKLELLKQSRRKGEEAKWKATAHYLKGSAASMGMTQLAEQCRQAELGFQEPYDHKNQCLTSITMALGMARSYADKFTT